MTTVKKMLQIATGYIGVSGTDNKFNTWYWGYHCYDPDVYPWCAVFQSYVAMEASLGCKYSASASGFATQFTRIPVEKENTVKQGDTFMDICLEYRKLDQRDPYIFEYMDEIRKINPKLIDKKNQLSIGEELKIQYKVKE